MANTSLPRFRAASTLKAADKYPPPTQGKTSTAYCTFSNSWVLLSKWTFLLAELTTDACGVTLREISLSPTTPWLEALSAPEAELGGDEPSVGAGRPPGNVGVELPLRPVLPLEEVLGPVLPIGPTGASRSRPAAELKAFMGAPIACTAIAICIS